jgi:hypothetical protein
VQAEPEAPDWLATALAKLDERAAGLRAQLDAIDTARDALWQAACDKPKARP